MIVELRSDTKTEPGEGMRRAMAQAEVGDEQAGEDPTVNRLCARVAALLGHESAVYLPSGTMCNQIAILVHCRPGDEIVADSRAHIVTSEAAGAAALAGAQIRGLDTPRGVFTAAQVEAAIRPGKRNAPRSRLVEIEQTVNRAGGTVWPLAAVGEVSEAAKRAGLAVHMDGARLMNAVVASGVAAAEFGRRCDSVWIDLSKGLGCPIGGVLAGSRAFVEEAWRWKHRLGGAMRQAGILAAAGLYALDNNVARLDEDHANARRFASAIGRLPGVRLDPSEIDTNMVFFDISGAGWNAPTLSRRLAERGVLIGADGDTRLRAVTHLGVDASGVDEAARVVGELLRERPRAAAE